MPAWAHVVATLQAPAPDDPGFAPDVLEALLVELLPGCTRLAHRFAPQGYSAVALTGDARLAIHTWPELRLATVDIHAAGSSKRAADLLSDLAGRLKWAIVARDDLDRRIGEPK